MIFAGYPAEMKDFLNLNPELKSRIKYKFNFPDYSVSELATILENGTADSGFRFGGETSLVEILEQETTVQIRSKQNGRLAKNIVAEAVINLSNRLSLMALLRHAGHFVMFLTKMLNLKNQGILRQKITNNILP